MLREVEGRLQLEMSWNTTHTTTGMSTMKNSRNWKGEWETRPLHATILQWNEIWGSTNPVATQWEHERWWRHLWLVDGVWKWLVELDVPSENRLELFRTGQRNEQDWQLRTKHSRCKRCWQHGSWKQSAAAISAAQNILLNCQQFRTAIITPRTRVALTFWMHERLATRELAQDAVSETTHRTCEVLTVRQIHLGLSLKHLP